MGRITYGIRERITSLLDESPFINNIHRGQVDDFLRQKKNFYPAARVDYGASVISNEVITQDVTVALLDQVDDGFGNEDDIINNMMAVAARLVAQLQEASHSAEYEISDEVVADYIYEYDDANLAGWGLTISITTPNTSHNNA